MAEKIVAVFEVDNKGAIRSVKQFRGEMEGVPKSTGKASKGVSGLHKTLLRLGTLITGAAILGAFRSLIRTFAEFETATVNVQNITNATAEEMAVLSQKVRMLPPALGSATELMKGLYQAISAGVPKENAVAFLAENAKAAKGNLADLTITVSASTSILAAYGLQASETTSILDAMTRTVDLGKLTFGDLASNIGKGIAIAASAGVTYQELMATMAALTLGGQSVEEAMTGIRNILAMTFKMKPGEGMKTFGVEMSVAAIKAKGFAGYMGDLATAVQGNAVAQAAMFPNLRAMQAAMSLVSEKGGKRLNFILGEINESTGKVESNFERMSNTLSAKMRELGGVFERGKIEIGEALSGIFTEATGAVDLATAGLRNFTVGLLSLRQFGATVNLDIATRAIEELHKEIDIYADAVNDGGMFTEHWKGKLHEAFVELGKAEKIQKRANKDWDDLNNLLEIAIHGEEILTAVTRGLLGGTEDLADGVKNTNRSLTETAEILGDETIGGSLIAAMEEGATKFSFFGDETNVLANAISAALNPALSKGVDYLDKLGKDIEDADAPLRRLATTTEQTASIMQSTFSDLLGRGFIGELETFADLMDAIWQDAAKSMAGLFGEAFEDAFGDGGTIFGIIVRFWDNMKQQIQANPLGAAVGGAGQMYAGYQQGGMGGFLQGAMGGMSLGGSIGSLFGPAGTGIGMGIGAGLGGLLSLFGGEDEPRVYGSLGLGGHQVTQSDTDLSIQARAVWAQQRISEYRGSIMAMNDVLRLFGEGDLFDRIGDAPEFTFDEADLGEITTIFSERWLPQAMRQMFRGAINRGLRGFGVDADTRQQLWRELSQLTGTDQITGLETFISSLVGISNLYDDMDWNAIMDESRQDSLTAFLGGMDDMLGAVQMQMLGLDQMTLLERAGQAQTIEQLITQARQAEIAMLMQIDALQNSINQSIDAQIEGLRTGGMSDAQLRDYYGGQVDALMAQLRAGVESPEALQQIMADLQRYIGAYQGVLGDDLYAEGLFGGTAADYFIGLLEEARGLSNDAIEAMRDQIRESNDALILELQRLIEALTHYGDTIATADQEPPVLDGHIGIDVNVFAEDGFGAWVDARIERWEWRNQSDAGPN